LTLYYIFFAGVSLTIHAKLNGLINVLSVHSSIFFVGLVVNDDGDGFQSLPQIAVAKVNLTWVQSMLPIMQI